MAGETILYSSKWVLIEDGQSVVFQGNTYTKGVDAFSNYSLAKAAAGEGGAVQICDKFYSAAWAETAEPTVNVTLDGEEVELTIGTEAYKTIGAARTAAGTDVAFVNYGFAKDYSGSTRDTVFINGDGQFLTYNHATVVSTAYNNGLQDANFNSTVMFSDGSSLSSFDANPNSRTDKNLTVIVDNSTINDLRIGRPGSSGSYDVDPVTGRITWGEGVAHSVANLIIRNKAVVTTIYLGSQGSAVTGEFNVTVDHAKVTTLSGVGLQNGGQTFGTETLTLRGGTVGTYQNRQTETASAYSVTIIAEEKGNRIGSFSDAQNRVQTIDIVVKDDAGLDLSGYSLVRVASVSVGKDALLLLGSGFQGTTDSVVTVAGTASFAGATFTGNGTSVTVKSGGLLTSSGGIAFEGAMNVEENARLTLQSWNGTDNVVTVSGMLTMAGASLTGDATSITVKSGATFQSAGVFNFAGDVVAEKGAAMVFGQNFGNSGHYTFFAEDQLNVTGTLTNNGTITVDAAGYTFDPGVSAVKVIDASNSLSTAGVELVNGEEGKSLFAWDGDIYYGKAPGYYSAGWAGKTGTVNVPGGTATLGENAFATYDEYLAYDSDHKRILDRYSVANAKLGDIVTLELPSGTIVNAVIDNEVFFAGGTSGCAGSAWNNFTDYSGNEVVVYGGTLFGGRTSCVSAGGIKTAFYNYTAILTVAGDSGPNVCANNAGTSGEIIIGKGSHIIEATLGRDMSNTTDIDVTIHVEDDATITRLSAIFNKTATCSSTYSKDASGKLVWDGGYSKAHFILTGGSVTTLAPTSYSGGFTGEITVDISGNAMIGTLAGTNVANSNNIAGNFLINMAGGTITKIDAKSAATGLGNRYFAIVAGGSTTSTIGSVVDVASSSGTDVLVKENSTLLLNSGLNIKGGVTLESGAAFTVQNLTIGGTDGLTLGDGATVTCANLTLSGGGAIALDSNASLTCTNLDITNAEITLASGASLACATGLTTLTDTSLTVDAGESFMTKSLTTTAGSTVVIAKGANMTISNALTNAGSYTFALEDGLSIDGTLSNTGTITVDAAGYTLAPGVSYVKVIDAGNDITSINGYELINNLDPDKELFVMNGDVYYGDGPVVFSAAWRDLPDGAKVMVDGREREIGKNAFQSNSAAKAKGKLRTQSLDIYVNNEWGASGTQTVDGYTVTLGEDAFNTVSGAVSKYASRTAGVINIVGGTYSPEGGEGAAITNFSGKPTVIENALFGSFFGANGSTDVDVTVRSSTITSGAYAGGRYSVYNANTKLKIVDSYVAHAYGNGLSPAGTTRTEIVGSTIGVFSHGRGYAENVILSIKGSTVTSILAVGGIQDVAKVTGNATVTLSDSYIKTIYGNVGVDGTSAKTAACVDGDVLYKIEGGVTTVQSFSFWGGKSSSIKIQIAENATLSVGENGFSEAAITVASGATFQLTTETTFTSTASVTIDTNATFDMKAALTVNASASISAAKGANVDLASSFTNKGHYTFALEDGLTVSGGTLDNTGTITIDADRYEFDPGAIAVKVVDAKNDITSLAGYEVVNGEAGKELFLWKGDIWYGKAPAYYSVGWAGKTGTVKVPGGTATLGVNAFATYEEALNYNPQLGVNFCDTYCVSGGTLGQVVTLELPSGTIVDAVIDNKTFCTSASTARSNLGDYGGNAVIVYGGTLAGGRTVENNCVGVKTIFYNYIALDGGDGPLISANSSGKKGEVIIGRGSHVQYVSRGRGTQSESDLDITIRMEDDATAKILSPAFYCDVSSTASFTKGENGEIIWNDAEGAHSQTHFILTGGSATHVRTSAYSGNYIGDITLDISGSAMIGDFSCMSDSGKPTFRGNYRINMAGGTIGKIDGTTATGIEDRYFAIVVGGTNTTSTIGVITNIKDSSGYSIVINAKDRASLNLGGTSTCNFTIDNTGFAFADNEHTFTVISGNASKLTYTLTDDTVTDYIVVQDDTGLYLTTNPVEISRKFEAYKDGDVVETYFGSGTVGVNAFRTLAEKQAAHVEGYTRFTDVFVNTFWETGEIVNIEGNTYTVGDGKAFNALDSARTQCINNGYGAVYVLGGSISSRTYLQGAPTYIADIDYPMVSGGGLVGGSDSGIENVEVVFAGGSVGSYWSARGGVVQKTHAIVKGTGKVSNLRVGYSGCTVVNALYEVIDGGYVESFGGAEGAIYSVAGGLWDYRVRKTKIGEITLGNSNTAGAAQLKGDVSLTLDQATCGKVSFSAGGDIVNEATYTFRITGSTVTGIGTSGLNMADMNLVSVKTMDFEATDSTIRQLHLYRISTTDKFRIALDNVTLDERLCLFNTIKNNSFGSVEASIKNMALTNGVQVFDASSGYANTVQGDASVVFDTVTLGGTSTNAISSGASLVVNGNLDVTLRNATSEKSFWLLRTGSTVGQNMTVTLADSDLLAIYNNGEVTGTKQLLVSGGASSLNVVCDFDTIDIAAGATLSVSESFGTGTITIADGATLRYGATVKQPLQAVVNNGTFYYNANIGQNAYKTVGKISGKGTISSDYGNVVFTVDGTTYAAEVQERMMIDATLTEKSFLDKVTIGGVEYIYGISAFKTEAEAITSQFYNSAASTLVVVGGTETEIVYGNGHIEFNGSTVTKNAYAGQAIEGGTVSADTSVEIVGIEGKDGSYAALIGGNNITGNVTQSGNSAVKVSGENNITGKAIIASNYVTGGTVTFAGSTSTVSIESGSFNSFVVGGALLNHTGAAAGTLTTGVTVKGGVVKAVIGGCYLQASADDIAAEACQIDIDKESSTNVTISGGTILLHVFGGNAGKTPDVSTERSSAWGGSTSVTIDASEQISIGGNVIAGNDGTGTIGNGTTLTFKGDGKNLSIGGHIVGDSASASDNAKGVTGTRSLIFDHFNGTLGSSGKKVTGFDAVSLTGSTVTLPGYGKLVPVSEWTITDSTLIWGKGANDFSGDKLYLNYTGELTNEWTVFQLADGLTTGWDQFTLEENGGAKINLSINHIDGVASWDDDKKAYVARLGGADYKFFKENNALKVAKLA